MAYEPEDLCQLIQQSLNEVAGENSGENNRHEVGLYDAVRSDLNTSAASEPVIMDSGDGKGPKLAQLEFFQRATPDETHTDEESVCEGGKEVTRLYTTRAITKFVRSDNLRFKKADLRKFCEAPPEYINRVIRLQTDAMMVRINRIGIGQVLAGVGGFYGNVSGPKDLYMIDATQRNKTSDPNGEFDLATDFRNMGYTGKPILVGAGNLDRYAQLADIGCCNNLGQDISATAKMNYYRDLDVDRVAGTSNNAIAFYPGAVQFASWLANKGDFAMSHAHFDENTIYLPGDDLEVDFEMNYDRCEKEWVLQMNLHFDFFTWPLNQYKAGDDNEGVNGVVRYKVLEYTSESA
jgi:hypothetical protein